MRSVNNHKAIRVTKVVMIMACLAKKAFEKGYNPAELHAGG